MTSWRTLILFPLKPNCFHQRLIMKCWDFYWLTPQRGHTLYAQELNWKLQGWDPGPMRRQGPREFRALPQMFAGICLSGGGRSWPLNDSVGVQVVQGLQRGLASRVFTAKLCRSQSRALPGSLGLCWWKGGRDTLVGSDLGHGHLLMWLEASPFTLLHLGSSFATSVKWGAWRRAPCVLKSWSKYACSVSVGVGWVGLENSHWCHRNTGWSRRNRISLSCSSSGPEPRLCLTLSLPSCYSLLGSSNELLLTVRVFVCFGCELVKDRDDIYLIQKEQKGTWWSPLLPEFLLATGTKYCKQIHLYCPFPAHNIFCGKNGCVVYSLFGIFHFPLYLSDLFT